MFKNWHSDVQVLTGHKNHCRWQFSLVWTHSDSRPHTRAAIAIIISDFDSLESMEKNSCPFSCIVLLLYFHLQFNKCHRHSRVCTVYVHAYKILMWFFLLHSQIQHTFLICLGNPLIELATAIFIIFFFGHWNGVAIIFTTIHWIVCSVQKYKKKRIKICEYHVVECNNLSKVNCDNDKHCCTKWELWVPLNNTVMNSEAICCIVHSNFSLLSGRRPILCARLWRH